MFWGEEEQREREGCTMFRVRSRAQGGVPVILISAITAIARYNSFFPAPNRQMVQMINMIVVPYFRQRRLFYGAFVAH